MKKSYLLYAIGAGLAFTACSSQDDAPQQSEVLEKGQSFYVNVAITTNSQIGTRAYDTPYDPTKDPEFEAGSEGESQVNTAYFVFYNDNGVVVGQPVMVTNLGSGSATSEDGNVYRSYTSIVQVDVNRGESKPTQVMCYINPVSTDGLANSLQNVETVARDGFNGQTGGFSMSNSVYYDGENLVRAVKIDNSKLYNSMDEAEKAVEANADNARVLINVERYASKVNFTFEDDFANTPFEPANGIEEGSVVRLNFVPEMWDVNATDKSTFVSKAFRTDAGLGSPAGTNMTYAQVNAELSRGDNWLWNSTGNNRSYWAFSPSYYTENFPFVANDIIENGENAYALTYLSYNKIMTGGIDPTTTTPRYAKETTTARRGLNSLNPAAAIASAVLAGHYEVSLNGTVIKDAGNDLTFYTMGTTSTTPVRPQVFFNASLQNGSVVSQVAGAPTMIEYMVDKETVLLVRSGAGTETDPYVYAPLTRANLPLVFNALTIARPTDDVYTAIGGSQSASRTVTLQIADLGQVASGYTLCINVGNGAQEIGSGANQISLVEANAALASATQWANCYNQGRAFFNIPIRHLGFYAGTNPNLNAANNAINYGEARVGDFGLVRNHVYTISVNSITGLGTAVARPDDPIVPPVETQYYYVAYRLNILNWAIVPVQNVDL